MRDATHDVEIERDVKMRMPDGVVLLADVFHPSGLGPAPTILERTPYGRAAIGGFDPLGGPPPPRGGRFVFPRGGGAAGAGGGEAVFPGAGRGPPPADRAPPPPRGGGGP